MNPFAQTIGHTTAQEVLQRLFAHDRPPHALLMIGPAHVGKTHLAHQLIRFLLSTNQPLETLSDVTIVSRETDDKTGKRKAQLSVKQIRALTGRLNMTSLMGSWKIAFIEEAHLLSPGAANALLKTLEEPKGKTLLILRAPSVQSVMPTIVSRCQLLRLSVVPRAELTLALQKRGLAREEAQQLSARALGRPGLALRYVQDSELRAQKELAYTQARQLFAATLPEQFRAVMDILPKTEADKPLVLSRLLDDWSEVLRDELLETIGCTNWCFEPTPTRTRSDLNRLVHTLERLQEVRSALPHHINPHLALEHLFV